MIFIIFMFYNFIFFLWKIYNLIGSIHLVSNQQVRLTRDWRYVRIASLKRWKDIKNFNIRKYIDTLCCRLCREIQKPKTQAKKINCEYLIISCCFLPESILLCGMNSTLIGFHLASFFMYLVCLLMQPFLEFSEDPVLDDTRALVK